MWELIKRLVAFALLLAIVVGVGTWSWQKLWRLRHPQRAGAKQLLENRLGSMTPEQRRLADAAVKRDWMTAVLAAEEGGWPRVKYVVENGPDDILQIERLALNASLQGAIAPDAASRFVDAAFTQLVLLEQVDPPAATSLLRELATFSPTEYENIGFDGSYLLIAPKLAVRHRVAFREYQDVLTPLLVAADPQEWNSLMERFEKALPRVAAIARDENLGTLYAWIYMLHADLAEALIKSLPPNEGKQRERDVLDFIGLNAPVLAKSEWSPSIVADQIKRLQNEVGPDKKRSLFEWVCSDGAVYWLVVDMQQAVPELDRGKAFQNAVTILGRYAGTDIPAILTSYSDNPDSFRAATDALLQFDNLEAPDETQRQVAAKLLSHYQKDSVFKAELAKHGAKLIPALSAGGENALAEISRNPNNIGKYVTPDGKPITGKPWWTWVPGGNIAYVGREWAGGHTTEAADWVWAGADVLIIFPMIKGGSIPVRMAAGAGRKTAGRVIAQQSVKLGTRGAAKAGWRVTLQESLIVLRNAGIKVSKGSLEAAKWAANNPGKVLIAVGSTGAVIYVLSPDARAWIHVRLEHASREAGRTLATMPGEFVSGIMDKVNELANRHRISAPFFYLLGFILVAGVFLMPLAALKILIPQAYEFLLYCIAVPYRLASGAVSWLTKTIVRTARPAA